MANESSVQQSLETVMTAYQVVADFQQSISDMFRTLGLLFEEQDQPYELLEDSLYTGMLSFKTRSAQRWNSKHFAVSLCPVEDPSQPFFLVNVSVDPEFSKHPELWLGVVSEMDCSEEFPYEQSLRLLYRDYFVPEDEWSEANEWYEDTLDDDDMSCLLSFLRLPLSSLEGWSDLERKVVQKLLDRCKELSSKNDEGEDS
ncbi:MAG: hypothetical protein EP343_09715 [Deltaproteobacteria bacterium]|nr:MAG: hypothetical protein EP343_09715 [Deltaproteobacteria bacterium]